MRGSVGEDDEEDRKILTIDLAVIEENNKMTVAKNDMAQRRHE